jgi:NADH:ubiquinone oxidoreductase subunit 5 (subunit L)/multisubunit Na+/H+ antiporter MnhA subunit
MASEWIVLFAVLAPVAFGLLTLWLPRGWIEPRMVVATAGPAIAFALLLSTAIDNRSALQAQHDYAEAQASHADHDQGHEHGDGHADEDASGHHGHADPPSDHHREPVHVAADAPAPPTTGVLPWMPSLNINLAFLTDGLGLFFGLLVSGIGTLIMLYARGYFGRAGPTSADDLYRFYPTLGFFTTAMLGVVLADYTLLTLLFWEMTSISSFLLIGWDRYDKKAVKLAMQAFFTTGLGGMGLFGGVLVFGNATAHMGIGPSSIDPATGATIYHGIWRWSDMLVYGEQLMDVMVILNSPGLMWAFVLMFIGAGTKSAQFPFHYWLPGAMAAPTPVSAFLHSATMVKAGVFLVGRLFPVFAALELFPLVIIPLGAVTMLYGGVVALQQHDLKRIFAFTTVSQLGLLMAMYGVGATEYHGQPAIDYDVTQIANHAFYKAPLFIAAGAIGHVLSRDITKLNGAFYKHPAICGTMMAAALGLAALPGTISFQAKELFLYGVYHAASEYPLVWIVLGMTVVTAVCNVAICVRVWTTLLGLPGGMREEHGEPDHGHHHEHAHEHGLLAQLIWLPGALIVSLQFVGGVFPKLAWSRMLGLFEQPATAHNYFASHYGGIPNLTELSVGTPLICSAIAIVVGVIVGLARPMRGSIGDFADRIYPAMYWLSVTGGGRCFRLIQTGNLKHYLLFVLGALLLGFAWAVQVDLADNDGGMLAALSGDTAGDLFEYWPGILLGLIVCLTAVLIPLTEVRIVRVLFLGACGFAVVGLYLVYQAPDLALTQLMFEIISVILFVIVLRLLPREKLHTIRLGNKAWRLVLSCVVGGVFGWMTLIAASTDRSATNPGRDPLGKTLAQHSYGNNDGLDTAMAGEAGPELRGGGGTNVVNVILVDFRGFDTLGEITVLGIAAMGVWSMMPHRRRRDGQSAAPNNNQQPGVTA